MGFQAAGYALDNVIYDSFRDFEEIRMALFPVPEAFCDSSNTDVSTM